MDHQSILWMMDGNAWPEAPNELRNRGHLTSLRATRGHRGPGALSGLRAALTSVPTMGLRRGSNDANVCTDCSPA